jgi:hypothetical protein
MRRNRAQPAQISQRTPLHALSIAAEKLAATASWPP